MEQEKRFVQEKGFQGRFERTGRGSMNKWKETGNQLEPGADHWTVCGKMVFLTLKSLWKNRTAEKRRKMKKIPEVDEGPDQR